MSFWDQFVSGATRAAGTISKSLPPCHICGNSGVQFCSECGRVGCYRHAFTCVGSVQSVCTSCMQSKFDWVVDPLNAEQEAQDSNNWPYKEKPWEILGVAPDADHETIRKAYKDKSRTAHPDKHGGSDAAQSKLNAARAEMLRRAA